MAPQSVIEKILAQRPAEGENAGEERKMSASDVPLPGALDRSASYSDYGLGSTGLKRSELDSMSVRELKGIAAEGGVDLSGVVEKAEIVSRIVNSGTVLISDF